MTEIDVTIRVNQHQLDALSEAMKAGESNVETELEKAFHSLYRKWVPEDQQHEIEQVIKDEETASAEEREAERRFAVFHVRERGEDKYFTSDYFTTLQSAGYRYRLHQRGELSEMHDNFVSALVDVNPITIEDFEKLKRNVKADHRATAVMEFDLDRELVRANEGNGWSEYRLSDVSTAAYKAFRSIWKPHSQRRQIFYDSLEGKDRLVSQAEEETQVQLIQS